MAQRQLPVHDFIPIPGKRGSCTQCKGPKMSPRHFHSFEKSRMPRLCLCGVGSLAEAHTARVNVVEELLSEERLAELEVLVQKDKLQEKADHIMEGVRYAQTNVTESTTAAEALALVVRYSRQVRLGL